jgi:hypothetical protein
MISRLSTSRFMMASGWQKVLSCRTLEIPKINHHTLISSSSTIINCKTHQQKSIVLHDVKLFHQKQQTQQKNENLIKSAISSIRNSPYFRIMRLDRPIGKFYFN